MACNTSEPDKDAEWPALSAAVSATDGRHQKNVQAKSKDNKSVNGHDSSKENNKESVNKNAGTRKKKNNKITWQPLQIETQPYRKKGTGRFSNESTKPADNDKNHRSRYESANNYENGRGNHRNGGFKGKRGRAYANYRAQQEEEFLTSENTACGGIIINGVTFFPQTFSDATRKNFLKRQMEYYFSDINLVSDVYLRLRMDNLGFVPLNIFLNFPRIMPLTRDINILADAVEESNKLELSYFNYQLYVRRIVDPLGWKIRNPYVDDIEIPFDDPYSNILPQTPENLLNGDEACVKPSDEADQTSCENSSNQSQDENKSNSFTDESNSDNPTSNEETCVVPVIEDDTNVSTVTHQIETLSLTADASLALNTLHIEPVDAQYVPSFTEESSNATSPVTASPSEYDIELSGVYIDSKAIDNGCDYFPAFSESVEQGNGCKFYSGNVYNDVIFYETNELSNQGPVYYMVNSRETLSTSSDNSNEEVLHLSPEPSR